RAGRGPPPPGPPGDRHDGPVLPRERGRPRPRPAPQRSRPRGRAGPGRTPLTPDRPPRAAGMGLAEVQRVRPARRWSRAPVARRGWGGGGALNEVRVESWAELNERLYEGSWKESLGRFRSSLAFRGMARADLGLKTSLMRLGGGYAGHEGHLLRNFRKY